MVPSEKSKKEKGHVMIQQSKDGGNWPSTTGNPSGGGRGNNPPGGK
jgi:hypothetical protein